MAEIVDQEQELDIEASDAETAVLETPAPQTPVQEPEIEVQRTERSVRRVPISQITGAAAPIRVQHAPRPKENNIASTDREFIDGLLASPDSIEWSFVVHRNSPSRWEGKPLKCGRIYTLKIMPYDSLYENVAETAQGGDYRIAIVDRAGKYVKDSKIRVINFSIPTSSCPPRDPPPESDGLETVEADGQHALPPPTSSALDPDWKKQMDEDLMRSLADERKSAARRRQIKADTEAAMEALQLNRLQKALLKDGEDGEGESAVAIKLGEMEQQRRESEQKAEQLRRESEQKHEREMAELRKDARDNQTQVNTVLAGLVEKIGAIPAAIQAAVATKDTGKSSTDLMLAMQANSMDMIKTLLPALVPKQDNTATQIAEIVRAGQEANVKLTTRENTAAQQLVNTLIGHLAAPDRNKGGGDLEIAMKFMEMGRKQTREMFEFAREANGGGGGGDAPGDDEGEGYTSGGGILGNAGKAIFAGIRDFAKAAANNPQWAELLAHWIGSRKPTEQQMIQHAHQMEMGMQQQFVAPGQQRSLQQGPPAVRQTAQPRGPLITPTSQFVTPGGPPQVIQPPPHQEVFQTPQPEMQAPTANPQMEVASEERMVEVEVDAGPQQQVEEEEFDQSTYEGRLRYFVTESIKIAIVDIEDQRVARGWVEDALQYWPKKFLVEIMNCADDQQRVQMIGSQCSEAVINKFSGILQSNGPELALFNEQMRTLIASVKGPEQIQEGGELEQPN